MLLFIPIAVLVMFATLYLVGQYLSRALAGEDAPVAEAEPVPTPLPERPPSRLKAA